MTFKEILSEEKKIKASNHNFNILPYKHANVLCMCECEYFITFTLIFSQAHKTP